MGGLDNYNLVVIFIKVGNSESLIHTKELIANSDLYTHWDIASFTFDILRRSEVDPVFCTLV
jgi:hypothetical protein